MVVAILFFLAGILSIQYLPSLPDVAWLLGLLLLAAVFAWRHLWLGVVLLAGMCWAITVASIQLADRLPERLAGQDIVVTGYVADLPEADAKHVRFTFKTTQAAEGVPRKLRLTWYYPNKPIKAGGYWEFTVRLKPPHGTLNPGGFDYERWLLVEGMGATGYVRDHPPPRLLPDASPTTGLLQWRETLSERLQTLKLAPANLAMIRALTIGDGNGLSPAQWEVFRATGTTHLMVISGSHVGLIAALVYLLTVKFWARCGLLSVSPQKIAGWLATGSAFLYAGLTGFAVPAQRAAVMVALAMLALCLQRNLKPFHTLSVALLLVILLDPLVVLLPGFWLSFLAVSLIIYVISGRLQPPGLIYGTIKINWATSLGLAPLLLFCFQQLSVIAPIANLIAVPVVSFLVVPPALAAMLLLALPLPGVIAQGIFALVAWVLQGLWWVLAALAKLPVASLAYPQPSWWALAFSGIGVLVLLAPKGMGSRWLGLVFCLPLVVANTNKPALGKFNLTLLDVGQGLAAVVQTTNHVLVYDTGAKFSENNDAGRSILLPYLRSQAITQVDTVLISHGDNDHIGGAESLLAEFKSARVLTSVPLLLKRYAPVTCLAGQSWLWDGVRFSILSPAAELLPSENDNSCVLTIQGQALTALLPGDIEVSAEAALVTNYGEKLKADILVAPHHGSQTSSTPGFLAAVNPSHILIPSGYHNPFGHPHQAILERYQNRGSQWLTSADEGAISVNFDSAITLSSWRKTAGRYWNYHADGQ